MPADLRIAVVGGGIGGLTLAIALAARDVPWTGYEQAPEHRQGGAGGGRAGHATRPAPPLGSPASASARRSTPPRSSRRRSCSAGGTTAASSPRTPWARATATAF